MTLQNLQKSIFVSVMVGTMIFFLINLFFKKEFCGQLTILLALEYLGTFHRKDQREILQGNGATEEQKLEFKQ